MSQDTTPQVILDPGECISVCGDLRGPILSRLRSACAPVPIADLLANHHADRHQAIRETLHDLEFFGSIRIDGKAVTALHGNGKPYTRLERRETTRTAPDIPTPGVDKGPGRFEILPMSEGSARVAAQRNAARSARIPAIIEAVRNGATLKDAFAASGLKSYQYLRNINAVEWEQVRAAYDEATRERMEAARRDVERIRLAILDYLRKTGGDTLEGIQRKAAEFGAGKTRTYNLLKAMRSTGDVEPTHLRQGVVHWVARLRN